VPVTITQETAWPAETAIRLTVEAGSPVEFTLGVRVPGWARDAQVTGVDDDRIGIGANLLRIHGPWSARTTIEVSFGSLPEIREAPSGERLVAHGPLLYALPVPGAREIARTFDVSGVARPFCDIKVRAAGPVPDLRLPAGAQPRQVAVPTGSEAADAPHAWQRRGLAVEMVDDDGRLREVVLVPMGATVLRMVAFPPA
jgi:hypothetical protein